MKFIALNLLLMLTVIACQSDQNRSENQDKPARPSQGELETFYAVQINGNLEADILASKRQYYLLDGDPEDIEKIDVEVKRGRLIIGVRQFKKLKGPVTVEVGATDMEAVKLSGSGRIQSAAGVLKENQSTIVLEGSGDITAVAPQSGEIKCVVSGSGDMEVSGNSKKLDVFISGSGTVNASSLKCDDSKVKISGSGNCETHVKNVLEATISGSGNVYYIGEPTVNRSISGSGKVVKRED